MPKSRIARSPPASPGPAIVIQDDQVDLAVEPVGLAGGGLVPVERVEPVQQAPGYEGPEFLAGIRIEGVQEAVIRRQEDRGDRVINGA